ncbi:hypothetical protein [Algoriphagus limi]|uniref:DUF115 domain-containing protein n=1 Tax=Algoriphagus limi TaxID=2975273 RepID=A0ABT2G1N9_9BACT|nr:hypothetical protein [Algoriphagus limi]MCS5489181.1 hypothetical protein [Algoriphagus limi]
MIQKEILNPYKTAFGKIYRAIFHDIVDRLLWDLNPESWKSRKKLKALHNKYAGQKAVILFNGPSLKNVDFSLLEGVFTIGLNKINLLYETVPTFRPSMIVASDLIINKQNQDYFNTEKNIPIFLDHRCSGFIKKKHNIFFLHSLVDSSFVKKPLYSISHIGSTPYYAFQLLYFMGFKEVAIIGADHNFPDIKPLQVGENLEEDNFHFHKNYHKKGEVNQAPDKIRMELAFRDAKLAFDGDNRKIYNSTSGGKLEVFERIGLEEFLKK